jgi:hypothetical protein
MRAVPGTIRISNFSEYAEYRLTCKLKSNSKLPCRLKIQSSTPQFKTPVQPERDPKNEPNGSNRQYFL